MWNTLKQNTQRHWEMLREALEKSDKVNYVGTP